MKKCKSIYLVLAMVCFLFAGFVGFLIADENIMADTAVINIPEADNIVSNEVSASEASIIPISGENAVLTFLNSSLGTSIVIFILAFILGKIFTAKPAWIKLVLAYGPTIMMAIKSAEKNIPDDTSNKGLARLDWALKYIIEIEPKLAKSQVDLKSAVAAVHAQAEANGNLEG